MQIDFENAIHPVDPYCSTAFLVILNLLLLSTNVVELNRDLIRRNAVFPGLMLSGYFVWEYAEQTFILKQRLSYGSDRCFAGDVLRISFDALQKNHQKSN